MTERRYRFCSDPERFILLRFDGDESALAFNCASGDTHLLSAFDHLLLGELRDRASDDVRAAPLSVSQLAQLLRPQLLDEEAPQLDEALERRLPALLMLGLIETAATGIAV